ncbi:MAG: alpha/beta hydrolase [Rhodospirillaceae bacterium]|nr:alpha/beta hydrolase [Rhodospirillaceae bacterium]
MRTAAAAGAGLALSGCAPIDLLNALVPGGSYGLTTDVAYGEASRQRLDIYTPPPAEAGPAQGRRIVVVFFYGGSWQGGARGDYRFIGEALAGQGFVTVIPDYRLHPEVRFPEFVHDAARAIAWVRRNIAAHGGDPLRVVVMGHSAGAHIAAMVALDPAARAPAGLDADAIKGFVGLAGPYSFDPLEFRSTRRVFGHLADVQAARPINFVTAAAPPMLLLHGGDDSTVGPYNSADMAAALARAGAPHVHKVYPDMAHIGIVLGLSSPFRNAVLMADVNGFVRGLFADDAAATVSVR